MAPVIEFFIKISLAAVVIWFFTEWVILIVSFASGKYNERYGRTRILKGYGPDWDEYVKSQLEEGDDNEY